MLYIALAAIGAAVVWSLTWARLTHSLIRQQARERAVLVDQIMHLAGRTWTPPPAAEQTVEEEAELLYDPAQLPDY